MLASFSYTNLLPVARVHKHLSVDGLRGVIRQRQHSATGFKKSQGLINKCRLRAIIFEIETHACSHVLRGYVRMHKYSSLHGDNEWKCLVCDIIYMFDQRTYIASGESELNIEKGLFINCR